MFRLKTIFEDHLQSRLLENQATEMFIRCRVLNKMNQTGKPNIVKEEQAALGLEAFAAKWDGRYPLIAKSGHSNWIRLIPMLGYPPEIRKAIYTTNAIESLNRSLRKVVKTRASFPNETAAFKLLYLALQNIQKKWTMPIPNWGRAINAFAILFEDRMPENLNQLFTQKN